MNKRFADVVSDSKVVDPSCGEGRPRSSRHGVGLRRALHGFSLIELLVVIAIISLLVSILLPSLKKAKTLAQRVVCSTNLRSIGIGLQQYAVDSNDQYPLSFTELHLRFGPGGMTYLEYMYGLDSAAAWRWGSLCTLGLNGYSDPGSFYCPDNDGIGSPDTGWPGSVPAWGVTTNDRYWGNYAYFCGEKASLRIGQKGRFEDQFDVWDQLSPAGPGDSLDLFVAADYHNRDENLHYNFNHSGRGNNLLYNDMHVDWTDLENQATGRMESRNSSEMNNISTSQVDYLCF